MTTAPWRITFDTNPDDCNYQCIMCEEHSPYSPKQKQRVARGLPRRRMDIAVLRKVLEEVRESPPREIIPSTMGEPLLYQHFDEIIDLCREYAVRLNLTTNGSFPGRGARAWAERIVPVGSDVKISFNGVTAATQEQIMCRSSHTRMLQNIRDFIEVRDAHAAAGRPACSVTLQVTFLESNVAELPDIVRLATELNVDRVKGHHLWDHFPEIRDQSMRRSPDAVERWNQAVTACDQIAQKHCRPNGQRVSLANFDRISPTDREQRDINAVCPFLGAEAWINHEGRFDPCCAPDDQRKSLGSFGNVRDSGFLSLWQGQAYQSLCEDYRSRPLCQGCLMRRPKSGGQP